MWLSGESVHKIYDILADDADTYTNACEKLSAYFHPMKDQHVAVYHFREASQGSDSIIQYVTRLCILAKACGFASVDGEIRAQILQKTSSRALRREILKHPSWELKDILSEARALETSEHRAHDIEDTVSHHSNVHRINSYKHRNKSDHKPEFINKSTTPSTSATTCRTCGRAWPHPGDKVNCLAKGKTCNACGKSDHFANVCRSTSTKSQAKSHKQTFNKHRPKKYVNNIAAQARGDEYDTGEDDEVDVAYQFSIYAVGKRGTLPHAPVSIMGTRVKMLIDSGAQINIINPSTYDLNDAYHQVELDPESRHLTTFSMHMGLFCYKRLNMGISCASEIFQKIMAQILAGIPGVKNIQDDIIVSDRTQEAHDERLKLVFKCLADRNITLRLDKCDFNKLTLTFYGFQFSKSGVSADPQKVAVIAAFDKPLNASEAWSLLGMTNYCARFIKSYANITEPIR